MPGSGIHQGTEQVKPLAYMELSFGSKETNR